MIALCLSFDGSESKQTDWVLQYEIGQLMETS